MKVILDADPCPTCRGSGGDGPIGYDIGKWRPCPDCAHGAVPMQHTRFMLRADLMQRGLRITDAEANTILIAVLRLGTVER